MISSLLKELNGRDIEAVSKHLDAIKQALEKEIDGTLDLLFGGSVSKNTYAHGISDVDTLVILDKSELAGKSPEEVCQYLETRLRERMPNTTIDRDGFAISVKFADITVELIPAIRESGVVRLPTPDCSAWSTIRPGAFSQALTALNQECASKAIPTIKLAKYILSSLPEKQKPTGYHIEAMAVQAFEGYQGAYTTKALLQHFFSKAPDIVRTPLAYTTGQSAAVDEYLGASGSVARTVLANSLARIERRMRVADAAQSSDHWAELLKTG